MRKYISIILSVFMLTAILTGCGQRSESVGSAGSAQSVRSSEEDGSEKLSVVTTIFPEYDWVMNILGDRAEDTEVTMLLDSGVDLHSFQPSADDIIKISTCDVFIYVGGESDEWVEDALQEATNKDMVVVNLMDSLGDAVKEEEVVEGMEEEEHEHEEEENHDEEHEEGPEYDEHVWLSLRNASALCNVIRDALSKADADSAEAYATNTAAYIEKLNALDEEYRSIVDAAGRKTVLFGDRFPFRYLVDDYGLSYYAAFVGCSAETEASFETVAFLAEKTDELGLPYVLTLEGTEHKIAETVISATSAKSAQVLSMDSMQSVTADDVKSGVTYLSIMEKNAEVLKEALS